MLIIFSLLILITTPWFLFLSLTYKIIAFVVLLALLVFKDKLNSKKLAIGLLIISVLLFLVSVGFGIKEIKTQVDIEREFASVGPLSKISGIFSNKYIESFRVSEDLLFQNLDFGNYFFAGHPRERLGVLEIQKFYAITIIFIFFGLIKVSKNLRLFLISAFIFSVSLAVLLKDTTPTGGFLTIPIFVFLMAIGLLNLSEDYGIKGKIILSISLIFLIVEGVISIGPI